MIVNLFLFVLIRQILTCTVCVKIKKVHVFFRKKYKLKNILLLLPPLNIITMNKNSFLYRAFDLYYDGFKHMTLGKTLWAVIIIKLIIMFALLKVFFFPNYIKENSQKGDEANFVSTEMLKRTNH